MKFTNTFLTLKTFAFLALFLTVGFTCVSCSNDDDNNGGASSQIVGLWDPTYIVIEETEGGHKYNYDGPVKNGRYDYDNYDEVARFQFTKDGKFTRFFMEKGEWEIDDCCEATYSVNGNTVVIKFTVIEGEKENYTVKCKMLELTDTQLILEYEEKEDDWRCKQKITFKRIG